MVNNTVNAFFTLLRAGLWEQSARLLPLLPMDFEALYKLADEQSVVGLIAAGLEHVEDMKITKPMALPFLKKVFSLEGRNSSMNAFIGNTVQLLREKGVYSLLVKGQGVAQCYVRPQWRSSGDIDFFLDAGNYEKTKAVLTSLASHVEREDKRRLHLGMTIDSWTVELHGTLHTEFSKRVNEGLDSIQHEVFSQGKVRVWRNGDTDVFLPAPDEDTIFVFTHFLEHFFIGGVGLRQLSDWCRLVWTYRDQIDVSLLESRLREMGILSEWKAFAAFAVDYLGMPENVMPLYEGRRSWSRKASHIFRLVLAAGNFGHNKDNTYRSKYPFLVEKTITFFRRLGEFVRLCAIFPIDAPRFFVTYVGRRAKAVL